MPYDHSRIIPVVQIAVLLQPVKSTAGGSVVITLHSQFVGKLFPGMRTTGKQLQGAVSRLRGFCFTAYKLQLRFFEVFPCEEAQLGYNSKGSRDFLSILQKQINPLR